jgi:hypothetical protein
VVDEEAVAAVLFVLVPAHCAAGVDDVGVVAGKELQVKLLAEHVLVLVYVVYPADIGYFLKPLHDDKVFPGAVGLVLTEHRAEGYGFLRDGEPELEHVVRNVGRIARVGGYDGGVGRRGRCLRRALGGRCRGFFI